MGNSVRRSYLYLHLSVIFWSFTAILGGLIHLSAGVLVWWRVALTSIFLLFWPGVLRQLMTMPKPVLYRYTGIGVLVLLHWLCFYGSIKLANASVALVTLSMTALFTAFIEPLIFTTRIDRLDIATSLIVIPAMYLTTVGFEGNMFLGFWLGILSAGLLSYFGVLNRKYIAEASPMTITFIEMSASWFFLSLCIPFLFIYDSVQILPTQLDLIYLVFLALGCTILPFILHLKALNHVSAFAASLVANLEPVYGIVLAIFVLKEHKELTLQFYIGVSIIALTIMSYPFLKRRQAKG